MEIVPLVILILLLIVMVISKLLILWLRPKIQSVFTVFFQSPNDWVTWKQIKIQSRVETIIVLSVLRVMSAPHQPMMVRARSAKQQHRLAASLKLPIPKAARPQDDVEVCFFEFKLDFRKGIGNRQSQSIWQRQLFPDLSPVPA
ncbi:hypothetical protein KC887_03865 [Candidatus Kaiserbacteria bacterium]|nr:hypothetical protein [Candidatus Kaiserbacteria bacterium]